MLLFTTYLRIVFTFVLLYTPAATALEVLSFNDCILEASAANPNILAAKSLVQSLTYQVQQAYSNFYPQLSPSIAFNYGSSQGSFVPALQARYNLFAGQADVSRVTQANANRDAALADLRTAKSQLSLDLKNAFANLARAQELVRVNESIKEHRETSYKLVSLLFESGRENYGSALLTKANLDQAVFFVQQANDALRQASIQLARALGRPASDELRAKGNVPKGKPPANPDFDKLASQTPGYEKTMAQECAAVALKNLSRAGFFPSVDLTSSVSRADLPTGANVSWLVGISLSYPSFNGSKSYYGFKSASQAITTAFLNRRALQQSDASTIANAHFAFTQAIRQLDLDQSFLKALTAQEQIAKENYNNGLLSFQNWDQIETSFIQRQQAVVIGEQAVIAAEAAFSGRWVQE